MSAEIIDFKSARDATLELDRVMSDALAAEAAKVTPDTAPCEITPAAPYAEIDTTGTVKKDQWGRPMYRFLLDFQMDGVLWATSMWAYDIRNAERRVAAMKESLVLVGQYDGSIEA